MRTIGQMLALGAVGAFATAAMLVAVLLRFNPGPWTAASVVELAAAMLWICGLLNGGFVAVLALLAPLVERLFPAWVGGRRIAFVASGLVALNLVWGLANRMQAVQNWAFPPRVVTLGGIGQSVLLVAVAACVTLSGVAWARGPRRARTSFLAAFAAAVLVLACLAWNARAERVNRVHDLGELQRRLALRASEPIEPRAGRPVLVIGIDGLSWNILVPLLQAGRLPHLASLVREGTIGYLDNGDDSFSPRIWNTVFSGRDADDHGVHDFIELVLPRTGMELGNFVCQFPSVDSFFGVRQMLRSFPSAGLWTLRGTNAGDVGVKRLWDVASDHGRIAVAANPINLYPVHPIRGAMITFANMISAHLAYPEELTREWRPLPGIGPERSVEEWADVFDKELDFALALVARHDADLGVYYTPMIDELFHAGWSFFAPDRFFLWRVPEQLDEPAWEALVLDHEEGSAIASYRVLDEALGRLAAAFPQAIVVICSDHGWTFGGYTHFGSPDGVLIASGRGIARGLAIEGARIEDVTPTVLALLGVPLSRELDGRVLDELLVAPPAVETVASYGPPGTSEPIDQRELDEGLLERLKALGYVR